MASIAILEAPVGVSDHKKDNNNRVVRYGSIVVTEEEETSLDFLEDKC